MKRDAAPEPFAQHDVTEAFSQMLSNLMKDPAKLAKGHADLREKSSFIKWALDQGFTVFAIS